MSRRTPGASKEAIQRHYDVGNEFFALWLDKNRVYSAAMWKGELDESLEVAQVRKLDFHIERAAAAHAGRVLDVGCGWGALLRRMTETFGVRKAVGVTLSREQADWIHAQADPRIEVRLESWQDHQPEEPYDAIISIGAFEHFADLDMPTESRVARYREFFVWCRLHMRVGSKLSLQTFAYGTGRDRGECARLRVTGFLAAEIFPETDPPTLEEIVRAIDGVFEMVSLRNDRLDYARTCRVWHERLRAHRQEAIDLAGEPTYNSFEKYLQVSALAFELGHLDLYRLELRSVRLP